MRQVLDLSVSNAKPKRDHHTENLYPITLPIRLKRRGVEMQIIMESKTALPKTGDNKLIKLVANAHKWFEALKSGSIRSVEEIAIKENINPSDVSRYLPLAFLAPDIVEAILEGSQPFDLTVHKIKRLPALPLSWEDQRIQLGFQA